MSNPVWPTTLPAAPLDGSVSYAPLVDNVIATSMETGAPKYRRRFTAVPYLFTGTLLVTAAQIAILDNFRDVTCSGVLPFDWEDFRTGDPATYVFTKAASYTRVPGSRSAVNPQGLWNATLELLRKP